MAPAIAIQTTNTITPINENNQTPNSLWIFFHKKIANSMKKHIFLADPPKS